MVLNSYFPTDDLTQPFKWLIPPTAVIPANGYLMFRVDGFDSGRTKLFCAVTGPCGVDTTTRRHHTVVSADGEALGFTATSAAGFAAHRDQCDLEIWDNGNESGTKLMTAADDSMLDPARRGAVAYGDGDETTVVSLAPTASKYPTTHFRKHFTITDPVWLGNIRCRVNVDDGAICISTTEFACLPAGNTHNYSHQSRQMASRPRKMLLNGGTAARSLFLAGDNVFAAEVHRWRPIVPI